LNTKQDKKKKKRIKKKRMEKKEEKKKRRGCPSCSLLTRALWTQYSSFPRARLGRTGKKVPSAIAQ